MAPSADSSLEPAKDKPPRQRRWIPLSLRYFAVVMVLLGSVGGGWVSVRMHRREAAIHTIERAGGEVTRVPRGPSWWPGWLRQAFEDAQFISLIERNFTDTDMEVLASLPLIDTVYLDHTDITNAGLLHLADHCYLETLSLYDTKIAGSGLLHLVRLRKLRILTVGHTQIEDSSLVGVAALTSLQFLDLRETRVTDAGLVHLKGLTSLRSVYLNGTEVSDAGIADLQRSLPGLMIEK
jgi:hypothetical protein